MGFVPELVVPLVGRKCRPPLATRLPSSPFKTSIFFRDVPLLPLHDLLQYAFKQLPTTPATCWHGGGRGDLFFAELGAELGEFEDESFPRVGPFLTHSPKSLDKIVGFHDATRLATLHNSRRCMGPSHPDTKARCTGAPIRPPRVVFVIGCVSCK